MRLPHPWLLLYVAADAALTRDAWRASCGVDDATPVPAAPAKRSVAVLIWGESFRDSRKRGERRRCGDGSLRAQNVVRDMHFRLFDALARMGYESRVFGVTASCDGAQEYGERLRVPSRAFGRCCGSRAGRWACLP